MEFYDDELRHSGRKGQKWHVRLYQNKDGSLTPLGRIHYAKMRKNSESSSKQIDNKSRKPRTTVDKTGTKSKKHNAKVNDTSNKKNDIKRDTDENRVDKIRSASKKANEMTNEELSAAIDRLKLEKSYKDLYNQVNPPPAAVETGSDFVKNLIVTKGQEAISNVTGKTMTYALGKMVDTILGVNVNTGNVKKPDKGKSDDDKS